MDINIPAGETLEDAQAAEPIPIKITGHLRDAKGAMKEKVFEFACTPDYPFGQFLDFLQSVGQAAGGARLLRFVEACLATDNDRERFTEMLHTPGLRLNPELLDLLSTSLIEAYTNRPTVSPSASAGGRSRAARRSLAAANGKA